MINYTKRMECVKEMRSVARNPIAAIKLLYAVKHERISEMSFVGYTRYYLNMGGFNLNPISRITIFKSRKSRLDFLLMRIDECWRLGFINDTQKALVKSSIRIINKLIKRYILIYMFL